MTKDNGGGSPQVRENGDAPQVTRLLNQTVDKKTWNSSWSSPEKLAENIKGFNGKDSWYDNNVWKEMDSRFSGVNSIHEAVDLAFHGWAEGGALIEKTRGYVQALNPLSPKLVKYGIAGSSPNVPRAIAGNILNMRQPEHRKSTRKKTITIVYNMCEAWSGGADAITNKAAVMAALIDEIEAKGFSCEVISTAVTSNHKMRCITSVMVKESHIPVDINRLAFGLGHSAMFRGLFFADWEMDDFCKDLGWGLGTVATTFPNKDQNAEQIYTITSGWQTQNKVPLSLFETMEKAATEGLNAIVSELQRQGCPAFPKQVPEGTEKKDHEDDLDEEPPEEEDEEDDDW